MYGWKNHYVLSKISITQPVFTIIGLGKQRFVKNLYTECHETPKDGLVIDRQADRMTYRCGPHTSHSFSPSKERVNCTRTIRVSNSGSDRSFFCFSKSPKRH
jgi:homoserine acetyltransferase